MVKRCCVKNCKSGQTVDGTAQNIASSFSLPKNAETRAKWLLFLQASGVEKVPKAARICENHFTKEEVRKEFKSVDKHGNVILQRKFSHASLVSGAVPTIFSSIFNYNNVIQHSVVESLPHPESNIVAKNNQDQSQPTLTMSDSIEPVVETVTSITMSNCTEGTPNDSTNQKPPDQKDQSVFNQIFHGTTVLRLPSATWGIHCVDFAEKLISFIYLRHHPTENNGQPYTVKQITFDENLNFKTYIMNKYTPISRANPQTIAEMESLIEEFHNTAVCIGGPPVAMYKNAVLRSAYKDLCNRWRHNLCSLQTKGESTCKYCVRVYKTADTHYSVHNKSRMPRLPSSPSTKKKIDILRKAKRIQAQALRRNQVRLSHVREELKTLSEKDFSRESFEEGIKKLNIPDNQVLLINECLKLGKCASKNGRRYTNEWILLCLLLNIRSPAAYNFLRDNEILPLPAPGTIRQYLRMVKIKCGFDEKFFQALRKKVESLPEMARHGSLVFDEIQVRKSLAVNTQTMTFDGLINNEDPGKKNSMSELADHGLVFMFTSVGGNFQQTIGVFACKGATPGTLLAQLVLQAIVELEAAGLYVDGIICDGASTNRRMWTELGISGQMGSVRHSFQNPYDESRVVNVFSDAPHLLKCVRNRLFANKMLQVCNMIPKWKHYVHLFEEDSKNPAELRVCHKITVHHVNPSNSMKMRVYLAAQVFSNSMAEGLTFYKDRNVPPLADCQGTIDFTLIMNKFFDAVNRKFPAEALRRPKDDVIDDWKVLENTLETLNKWELQLQNGDILAEHFLTKQTAEGLRVTIHSTIALSKYLLEKCHYKYVLTAKLNQDCLEQFFGIIRQAGGQNDHPTLPTFLQLYRLLSVYKLLKPPKSGNCREIQLETKPGITMDDFKTIFEKQSSSDINRHIKVLKEKMDNIIDTEDWECEDVIATDHDYCQARVSDCIIYYITGFLSKKLMQKTNCDLCKSAIVNSGEGPFSNNNAAQLVNTKTHGYLIHPHRHLFNLFSQVEKCFQKNMSSMDVYNDTIDEVLQYVPFTFPCEEHKCEVLTYALHYFVAMRMRQYAKQITNHYFKQSREKKKFSKLYNT